MSRLLRMAYGHGGAGRERILVAAPPEGSVPAPRWLKPLLLLAWLAVPVLVSRFGLPTTSQTQTIIDVSRLDVAPLPLPEPPVTPEPPPFRQVEPPLPAPAPTAVAEPPAVTPAPVINRPTRAPITEQAEYQPQIARPHARTSTEAGAPAAPQIRQKSTPVEAPGQRSPLARPRGVSTAEAPVAGEHLAAPRRSSGTEETTQGTAVPQRPFRSSTRSTGTEAPTAILSQNVTRRERVSATTAGETASPAPGVTRVPLGDLGICASTQEKDDAIKAVLGVVGSRQSCTDEKGEFQFRGTKRFSSFNLIIYPGNGRKPSNQCEELKNAYRCLKAR